MPNTKSRSKFFRRKLVLLTLLVIVAAAVVAILELTDTTYIFHKKTVPKTILAAVTKTPSSQKSGGKSASTSGLSAGDIQTSDKFTGSSAGVQAPTKLTAPFGNFVSNHKPGQNGSTTKEESVCNTAPGASCSIAFTNQSTGQTTKLVPQVADGSGTASWSWDAKTLSSGQWQITATAVLDGQSKSTTDTLKLEIQ